MMRVIYEKHSVIDIVVLTELSEKTLRMLLESE